MKNDIPYNVVTFNEGDGSNTVHSSEANFEVANLKALSLRRQGLTADVCYAFVYCDVIEITHENLNTFYPYMSNEDKIQYKFIIDMVLRKRFDLLEQHLSMCLLDEDYKEVLFENYRIEQSVFRIKDKLLPIDDYIKKIMSSEAYTNREC